VEKKRLHIAMLSIHSCPVGELGTKDTGGMNVYIRELATELGNRGHRVDIYTRIHDPNDPQTIALNENVSVIHLKAGEKGRMHKLAIYSYLADFFFALENFRKQHGLQYNLIHSHYWLSGEVGVRAQESWNVPHVLMFHTLGAVKNTTGVGEREPRLRLATEAQLIKSCHRIIAATEKEKKDLMRFYNALPDNIGTVPCGVNLDRFRPVDKAVARSRLDFGRDENIVIYVGRFEPLKGIERLLEAMSYLQRQRRMRLVIIGGDGRHTPEFKKLKKLCRDLRLDNIVGFTGRIEQENLPSYYSAADVLVVPSYHESFGLVALESLACGTPVVATDVGAMKNIIQEGKTGRVVADANPYLLAKGIEEFLEGSAGLAEPVDSIRASVLKFDWSNIADAMIDEYRTVFGHEDFCVLETPASYFSPLRAAGRI
jgi:D-inositol-3-phosphate glycosyltransferase